MSKVLRVQVQASACGLCTLPALHRLLGVQQTAPPGSSELPKSVDLSIEDTELSHVASHALPCLAQVFGAQTWAGHFGSVLQLWHADEGVLFPGNKKARVAGYGGTHLEC